MIPAGKVASVSCEVDVEVVAAVARQLMFYSYLWTDP